MSETGNALVEHTGQIERRMKGDDRINDRGARDRRQNIRVMLFLAECCSV
jgi:hypothetical protein